MFYSNNEIPKKFIREAEVRVFGRELKCLNNEDCDGSMLYTGATLTSNPPWFVHACSRCGFTANLREKYPTVIYKNIEVGERPN